MFLEFKLEVFLYKKILYTIIAIRNTRVPKYSLSPALESIPKCKNTANALHKIEIVFLNLGAKSCISDSTINPLI